MGARSLRRGFQMLDLERVKLLAESSEGIVQEMARRLLELEGANEQKYPCHACNCAYPDVCHVPHICGRPLPAPPATEEQTKMSASSGARANL